LTCFVFLNYYNNNMIGQRANNKLSTNNNQQLLVNRFKLLVRSSKLLINSNSSFTLIELLVVIALIAVLAVAVILSLNPSELLKQGRDSTRLSDLQKLNSTLSWFEADTGGTGFMGSSSVIYVSVPDTSPTCSNLGLPTLPSGWSYRCVTQENLQKTDGSGWIPVNFNQISFGKTLTKLPIDPINQTSTGNYYTYVAGGSWKLTTRFDSQKYTSKLVAQDGGPDPALYELGTDLNLAPFVGGLVGYWSFDEGSGTTANDYSGYGNNGTLVNGPTWTTGKVGGALSFDGVDDKITGGSINVPTKMTIMGWIKKNTSTDQKSFFSNRGGGTVYFGLSFTKVFLYDGIGSPKAIYSNDNAVSLGQWQHVTATSDGVVVKFYVNGNLVYNTNQIRTGTTGTFGIGWDPNIGTEYWDGLIDDLRIYNRALSDAEIQAIYNATK
jgi:prepilin-type N-terminal cleavage/methylation domain-containing protein